MAEELIIYDTVDVFTPTKPAICTYVERAEINSQLVDALMTPGKQLIVYGFTGSGKTTLLRNKLHQLYDNYISTSCSKGMKLDQIRLNAFDQLDKYFISTKTIGISSNLSLSYQSIKAELAASNQEEYKRIIPIQLNDQRLAEFLGEAKCCWIIEDFHKVEKSEKEGLAQMMKVFMDMASIYKEVKIVAIGAVGSAKEVINYDKEMSNRVAEIHVKLMSIPELEQIISLGSNLLNVFIPQEIKNAITYYSNGLAGLCHQMCLSMCFHRSIYSTTQTYVQLKKSDFENSVKDYINQNSETLKAAFDKAKKLDKVSSISMMEIFKLLVKRRSGEMTFEDTLTNVRKRFSSFNAKSLRSIMNKLTTPDYGEILRYDNGGKYYFFTNPFYRLYVQYTIAESYKLEDQYSKISIKDIHAFLKAKEDMKEDLSYDDLDYKDY